MAVKLRLKRMGTRQRPFYRIIAADSRSPRDGRFIETLGTYQPIYKDNNVTIDEEKVLKWLNNGAQVTDTVKDLLSKSGLWAKFKKVTPSKKVAAKKETAKAEEPKKEVTKKAATKATKKVTKKSGK